MTILSITKPTWGAIIWRYFEHLWTLWNHHDVSLLAPVANSMGSQQQSEGCWVFSGRWMLARPWSMSSQECLFAARVPLVPQRWDIGHQSFEGFPFWYGWPGGPLGPFSPCNLTMAHQVSCFFRQKWCLAKETQLGCSTSVVQGGVDA